MPDDEKPKIEDVVNKELKDAGHTPPTREAYEESLPKQKGYFFGKNYNIFNARKMADDCMSVRKYIYLSDNKEFYVYIPETGIWMLGAEMDIKVFVSDKLGEKLKKYYCDETIDLIKTLTTMQREQIGDNSHLICMENGVFNLFTQKFLEHDSDLFMFNKIPITYDIEAKCSKIIEFLYQVLPEDSIPIIQELIGYCLLKDYRFHKAFMFTGSGANGKSTLLNTMQAFIGRENISNLSLQALDNQRFAPAVLHGKMANLCNDIPKKSLVNTGMFKQLCGGDYINAEKKFGSCFSFVNYAKLCFSCNDIPESHDDSDAFFRRMCIIDFPNKFEGKNRNPSMLKKITTPEELSGLFNWAVVGLERLIQQGDFSISQTTEDTARDYKRRSSPVASFVMDCIEKDVEGVISKEDLYDAYRDYCSEHEINIIEKAQFGKKLIIHASFVSDRRGKTGNKRIREWAGICLKNV